jgi:hypothetical protein
MQKLIASGRTRDLLVLGARSMGRALSLRRNKPKPSSGLMRLAEASYVLTSLAKNSIPTLGKQRDAWLSTLVNALNLTPNYTMRFTDILKRLLNQSGHLSSRRTPVRDGGSLRQSDRNFTMPSLALIEFSSKPLRANIML